MSNNPEEFKHESLQDRQSIVKYLNALSEGFENGQLVFANKDKQIIFEPRGLLKLDVKAKRKNEKVKLSLKFSWKEDSEVNNMGNGPLIIEPKSE